MIMWNKKKVGDKRVLLVFLDVPAALGSNIGMKILKDEGNFDYPNMKKDSMNLKKKFHKK